jgi:hypothetical protein
VRVRETYLVCFLKKEEEREGVREEEEEEGA